nr:M48 family metalloprotease [Chloroflexota bacterium]
MTMQMPSVEPRPWAPVPGPVDRTSFFEEQARHRRSTWRLTALCLGAVVLMGLVVSVIVTPLAMGQLGFVGGALELFLPGPDILTAIPRGYFDLLAPMMHQDQRPATFGQVVVGWALLLLPGVAVMLLIWTWLRWLFLRAGVGGALLSLGAREPRAGDLEEQQLVNVVAEMAVAAGLPPPRVVLLDSDVPNAAAIGSGPHDATVVVSRRLLDEFDRDQTQAALGHLIGSIGNGDLRIAFAIVSVYQTFGLLCTLLD